MNIIRIPKGKGKFRTIYVPNEDERAASAGWVHTVASEARMKDTHGVQHGFTEGRNCVTNAMAHIGFQYTLSMDLKDFFDTVKPNHVQAHMRLTDGGPSWISACFHDGAARQGLPSSPSVANLAASAMDADIVAMSKGGRIGKLFVYTRYADDLTFSFNHPRTAELLLQKIPEIVAKHGFTVNESKTHLQCAKAGRRVITGIAVDDQLHCTREVKRRLRAAQHQMRTGIRGRNLRRLIALQRQRQRESGSKPSLNALLVGGARGLAEWAKLKTPKKWKPATTAQAHATVPHVVQLPVQASNVIVPPVNRRFTRRLSC